MTHLHPALCLLGLLLPVTLAADPVYRWTDGDGRVHYGDRPAGPRAEAVEVDPMPPADGGAHHRAQEAQRRRILHMYRRERERREYAAAYAARQAASRRANCATARDNLRAREGAPLLYEVNDAGERDYLTDQQRAGAIRRAREAVAAWCP